MEVDFQAILEAAPDAMVIVASAGKMMRVNARRKNCLAMHVRN